jgi:hypothetical protein
MKRKTFLASLLGMLALPFGLIAKKKEEPKVWIIRESFVVDPNQEYQEYGIGRSDAQARARILTEVSKQIKVWETGRIGRNGKPEIQRHFMVVLKPIK